MSQSKTNQENGTILGISPCTVQKHLERAYGRLGMDNRHATDDRPGNIAARTIREWRAMSGRATGGHDPATSDDWSSSILSGKPTR